MTYQLKNEIIRASAGSGKTFTLSNRYLKLILSGASADSILATTFTRAAAGEIQNRVLSRLGKGASSKDDARKLYQELAENDEAFRIASGLTSENALEKFRTKLAEVAKQIQRLRICTLDSFFMQLAGGYSFELGLPPNWHIVEEVDSQNLLRRALLSSFAQAIDFDRKNISDNIDADPVLTLVRSLFKGEYKRSIAQEVETIVNKNLSIYYEATRNREPWLRLAKSFDFEKPDANSLANDYKNLLNNCDFSNSDNRLKTTLEKKLSMIVDCDWNSIVTDAPLNNIRKNKTYYRKGVPQEALDLIARILQTAKEVKFHEQALQLDAMWETINAISRYFEQAKHEGGAYRFDDVARILQRSCSTEETAKLFYRLDAQTSHILLDEFQDASLAQWAVIKPFAKSVVRRDDKGSFFCVGDVKQAIYAWRGGKAEIFDAIDSDIENVETSDLPINWRSSKVILDAVNYLFEPQRFRNNPAFHLRADEDDAIVSDAIKSAVNRWATGFREHQYAPKNAMLSGYFTIEQAPIVAFDYSVSDPSLEPIALDDSSVENVDNRLQYNIEDASDYINLEEGEEETNANNSFESVDSNLQKRLQKKALLEYTAERIAAMRERYPEATIGVLARTNGFIVKLTKILKKRFRGENVVISEEGGAPIVDSPAVNAVLSVLSLAAHTGDSVAAFHIASLKPLAQKFELDKTNYEKNASRVSERIRMSLDSQGLGNFVAKLRDLLTPMCDNKLDKERLDKLVQFAYSYPETCERFTIDQFIRATREYKTESPSASNIRVMSMHKSKGLQFDIVFLPELEKALDQARANELCVHYKDPKNPIEIDGIISYTSPQNLRDIPVSLEAWLADTIKMKHEGEILEALNLLYVGLTRPVRALFAIVQPRLAPKNGKFQSKSLNYSKILQFAFTNEYRVEVNQPIDLRAKILYESSQEGASKLDFTPKETSFNVEAKRTNVPLARFDLTPGMQERRLLFHRETPTESQETREWFDNSTEALQRGTALHKCFEAVRWLDLDGAPDDEKLKRDLMPIFFDKKMVEDTIKEFKSICESKLIREMLSSAGYRGETEVQQERPFSIIRKRARGKDALVRGAIDRLVLTKENGRVVAADVIDYKSNRYCPGDDHSQYDEQLREYGKAIQELYQLEPEKIKLRYVFVGNDWPEEEREHLVAPVKD